MQSSDITTTQTQNRTWLLRLSVAHHCRSKLDFRSSIQLRRVSTGRSSYSFTELFNELITITHTMWTGEKRVVLGHSYRTAFCTAEWNDSNSLLCLSYSCVFRPLARLFPFKSPLVSQLSLIPYKWNAPKIGANWKVSLRRIRTLSSPATKQHTTL